MAIRAFLFDVDGVLYDSMPQHATSWQQAFKEAGHTLPLKPVYLCEGMPETTSARYLADSIPVALPEDTFNALIERKRSLYNTYPNPPLIAGARELIAYLREHTYKVCFVTGSYQLKTIANLKKDFMVTRADIITGTDVVHGKPNPEPYRKALERLGVSKDEAVVVENAPLGIESAIGAGVQCIVLETGLITKEDLQKYEPRWMFKDCAELLARLEEVV